MDEKELIGILTFNSFSYKKTKFYYKLKEDFGSLYNSFLRASLSYFVQNKFPRSFVDEFLNKKDMSFGKRELEKANKYNVKIITVEDDNYPPLLKELQSPPVVLYVMGNVATDSVNIAIVGTRNPSQYGVKMAEKFSYELSKVGFCIVSGLARGIDTIAHKICIKTKGKTYAVLGSGLLNIYPSENRKVAEALIEAGGAIISEYPLHSQPEVQNFPARNRIISGLSLGVLVIEAPIDSGALITANWAIEQNREVFVVPGNINVEQSVGCLKLAQEGAKIVLSTKDILEEFPDLFKETVAVDTKRSAHIKLSDNEKLLLNIIKSDTLTYDEICYKVGIPMQMLNLLLLNLEVKGLIKKLPGNRYSRGEL